LSSRRVDLIEENFDAAIRIGRLTDSTLIARKLGSAKVLFCASPKYFEAHGKPKSPHDLRHHECLIPGSIGGANGGPNRWPFRGRKNEMTVAVSGRLRFSTATMTHQAARRGLGIAAFPEFACADDIRSGRLVSVLDDFDTDHGGVYIVYPSSRYLAAAVRAFVDLVISRFTPEPPWAIKSGAIKSGDGA
jgi:DNA-binding transcriptional LysR family regulator